MAQSGSTAELTVPSDLRRRDDSPVPRPPLDPELAVALADVQRAGRASVTFANLATFRELSARAAPSWDSLLAAHGMQLGEREVPVPGGASIAVAVLSSRRPAGERPAIIYLHGGGMIMGTARTGIEVPLEWAAESGAVVVSVEYRLAPEFPDPVPAEDCYAALIWVQDHAEELGIDSGRVIVAGTSAGGGLAAAVALMARDRGGPQIIGQVLMCPMIDDRNETPSSYELINESVWDRASNLTGWDALLGPRRGGRDVGPYAAPSRAVDLTALPPAYIDVGSCEIFRDEDIEYAVRLWRAGGQAELHVWPGGFHSFDTIAPTATLSVISNATRRAWVKRLLSTTSPAAAI